MSEQADQPGSFEIRLGLEENALEPNWGATGQDFRLWRVKEALAQVEKRLSSQATTLAAYETRTSSLMGWLSAEALATIGAVVSRTGGMDEKHLAPAVIWMVGSIGFIIPMALSAFYLSNVFRKKIWTVVGADAEWLMTDREHSSEVECLEEIIEVYIAGIQDNENILDCGMDNLQTGRAWFLLTPVIGFFWVVLIIFLSMSH
ncbi:hypothetical protein [Novacetimonas hansenii]|uniref:hypothetical protein n=1 Tax=Novacetimonas hansenii TaxID=436 RepID=UPI00094F934F|nr:hypothetical protein [Novacetimonas hansenii]